VESVSARLVCTYTHTHIHPSIHTYTDTYILYCTVHACICMFMLGCIAGENNLSFSHWADLIASFYSPAVLCSTLLLLLLYLHIGWRGYLLYALSTCMPVVLT